MTVDDDAAPAIDERYLYGASIDQILAVEDDAGGVLWALADHEATVRDVLDQNGVRREHRTYDSFGNLTDETEYDTNGQTVTPGAIDFVFGFTGRPWDQHAEFYDYRRRMYDPAVGRFASEDPSGLAPDPNRYRYANNSPVQNIDPMGLDWLGFSSSIIPGFQSPGSNPYGFAASARSSSTSVGYATPSMDRLATEGLYYTGAGSAVRGYGGPSESASNGPLPLVLQAPASSSSNPFTSMYAKATEKVTGSNFYKHMPMLTGVNAGNAIENFVAETSTGVHIIAGDHASANRGTDTGNSSNYLAAKTLSSVDFAAETARSATYSGNAPGRIDESRSAYLDIGLSPSLATFMSVGHGTPGVNTAFMAEELIVDRSSRPGDFDQLLTTQGRLERGQAIIVQASMAGQGWAQGFRSMRRGVSTGPSIGRKSLGGSANKVYNGRQASSRFLQEGTGSGRLAPYHYLPASATLNDVMENAWIPGRQGITLTDSTIRFSDVYRLTENTGIEFGLTRELVGGRQVRRLYSGGQNAVTLPTGSGIRSIGHTHPSAARLPSSPDINSINRRFMNALEADSLAPVPHSRVIWGSGATDSTIYHPNVLR